jgi:general secretion pathway protein D
MRAAASMLGLMLAGTASAQQQIQPNYREADIRQIIEAVGAVTGRNFLVDPRVRAQVTLLSFSPMTPDAFYQAFLATLEVHGYAALEAGGVVKIVPDANARQLPGAEGLPQAAGDQIVTQTIAVNNIGAAQLVPILRPLIPQYGHLAAHPTSNILIISDRAANVARMVNIIRRMDQAGSEDIEVIRLENASSAEVVRMLSALNQAAEAAGGAPAVQLAADERTNSIMISGTDTGRLRYRALVAHLDTPSEQGGDTRVRYLNYAEAEDLATKLQAQFSGTGAAPTPDGGAPAAAGGLSIWADAGTNALVINAPPRVLDDMMAVIDKIDIRRAQVKVDAIIVEISDERAAELGVTWVRSDENQGFGLTNFSNTTGGVIDLAVAATGETPNISAIAQGLTFGVGRIDDDGSGWAAILSALRGDAATNIISTPSIVTMDNEQAEIRVGQEVPFLTGQFTNTGAAAGSVNPFQTIQREEVGTRLTITPQINEGSGVKLTIEQETSSIGAGAAGAVDLITNNRVVTTSVFVEDNDILVLGGLIDDTLREGEQRVPVLGRIPGLGWLFRARSAERVKTNLMVFIRPTILRDRTQAVFETNTKYNYIRDLQRQQAEEDVRLLRGEGRPMLPELPPPDAAPQTPPTQSPPATTEGDGR